MSRKDTEHVVMKFPVYGIPESADEYFDLLQLQTFVHGFIEIVQTCIPHHVLVINEEGILDDLPININATRIVAPGTLMLGGIRGPALLITQ